MSMVPSFFLILAVSCAAVMLVLGGVVVFLWIQNRAADQEMQQPAAVSNPRSWPADAAQPIPIQAADNWQEQISVLLAGGNKIEAIKIYRAVTGVGLKEAKDAVEALERGEILPVPEIQTGAPPGDMAAQVHSMLAQGDKIEAIKLYRQSTGAGLKEAKDAVEALERGETMAINKKPMPAPPGDLAAQVRGVLAQDGKIEAIKLYRQATGAGLKEAKDAVDAIEEEMES